MEWIVIASLVLLFIIQYFQLDNRPKPPLINRSLDVQRKLNKLKPYKPALIIISTQQKQVYLKSPQWNTLRKIVLKRDNYTCQRCNINGIPLEIHHITYERFTNENTSDLVALCRECHQSVHNLYGYDYNTKYPIK